MGENLSKLGENERKWEKVYLELGENDKMGENWEKMVEHLSRLGEN